MGSATAHLKHNVFHLGILLGSGSVVRMPQIRKALWNSKVRAWYLQY